MVSVQRCRPFMTTPPGPTPKSNPPWVENRSIRPSLILDMEQNTIPSNGFTTVRGPYTRKAENGGGEILVLEQSGDVTSINKDSGEITIADTTKFIMYTKEVHDAINEIIANKGYVILK